jgi:Flp pilus assembly protein TadG
MRLLHRLRDDRGDGDVIAMMFIVPLAFGVILLYSFVGRQAASVSSTTHAADVGARAAALAGSATDAPDAARAAVTATLSGVGTSCAGGPGVEVSATEWAPGGVVTVTVTCRVETGDLAAINAPGQAKTVSGSAIIDRYREFSP